MTPRQAVEFLALAARGFYPIARADEFNAAIQALGRLIDDSERKPELRLIDADKPAEVHG